MASFYDYSVTARNGEEVKMSDFKGKVVMVGISKISKPLSIRRLVVVSPRSMNRSNRCIVIIMIRV